MREVSLPPGESPVEAASFLACLATVLERPFADLPALGPGEDPAGGAVNRWLGGLGLGLVPITRPDEFSWPGPWIARVNPPGTASPRYVLMYGNPSGVVWDPAGGPGVGRDLIDRGFVVAATDIALALPPRAARPAATGSVEAICVATAAGQPVRHLDAVRTIAGSGLEGDRHLNGTGTFPSGVPGSALTMIGAEVCESFDPPLGPDEHRRNLITRGIDLNGLVGHEFTIGAVRCRGARLCEPCTVVERYAGRPVLRPLVHRGGLRVDILADGEIKRGDLVRL
jgi:MOSC domain-containing protein